MIQELPETQLTLIAGGNPAIGAVVIMVVCGVISCAIWDGMKWVAQAVAQAPAPVNGNYNDPIYTY